MLYILAELALGVLSIILSYALLTILPKCTHSTPLLAIGGTTGLASCSGLVAVFSSLLLQTPVDLAFVRAMIFIGLSVLIVSAILIEAKK